MSSTPTGREPSPAELAEVERWLAATPTPRMPADVAGRLDTVLAGEVERRERKHAWAGRSVERVSLGEFGADLHRRSRRRTLAGVLAAAALAAAVGFGAYVVSASAGLNEPPVVAAVSSRSLDTQAARLAARGDLEPHRFSRAWQCARQATSGRITALANTTVDGVPALLVYLRRGSGTVVVVVQGCGTGQPEAGPSAPIADR